MGRFLVFQKPQNFRLRRARLSNTSFYLKTSKNFCLRRAKLKNTSFCQKALKFSPAAREALKYLILPKNLKNFCLRPAKLKNTSFCQKASTVPAACEVQKCLILPQSLKIFACGAPDHKKFSLRLAKTRTTLNLISYDGAKIPKKGVR